MSPYFCVIGDVYKRQALYQTSTIPLYINTYFMIFQTKYDKFSFCSQIKKRLRSMNEEIEKMKKAVNIDYAPVTLDKSDKKVGLSFL